MYRKHIRGQLRLIIAVIYFLLYLYVFAPCITPIRLCSQDFLVRIYTNSRSDLIFKSLLFKFNVFLELEARREGKRWGDKFIRSEVQSLGSSCHVSQTGDLSFWRLGRPPGQGVAALEDWSCAAGSPSALCVRCLQEAELLVPWFFLAFPHNAREVCAVTTMFAIIRRRFLDGRDCRPLGSVGICLKLPPCLGLCGVERVAGKCGFAPATFVIEGGREIK